ncbi:hypothetical protein JNB_01045 [Janibacter sp. HTCC2649]|nr:hypothetical protein JNB_01045 [Janibacter sp. HTCC2649]
MHRPDACCGHDPLGLDHEPQLILVGLLLLTGLWEALTRWLQAELVSGFQMPI